MTGSTLRPRGALRVLLALLPVALGACEEEAPTSVDLSLLPLEPITLEIQLPWAEFGSNLTVYGGYSGPADLGRGVIARAYAAEGLDAHTLLRFDAYPLSATVRDDTETLRTDTDLSFYGGYVVARFDPIASTNTGPVTIGLSALQTEWHAPSATWDLALDTVADQRAWPEPGGGPVTPLTTRDWIPADGDSVQLFLDSAQVALWNDAESGASGARLELLTDGERLQILEAGLRLMTRSSIDPDTVLILDARVRDFTIVYDVEPAPPADGMRLGGVPSWRTVLDVTVAGTLDGPPELCAAVGCPFTLLPRHVSYAGLALRSRSPADAFQPTDSVALDVRPVLSRASLPKSPLGSSLIADQLGQRLAPALFGALEGSSVEVPITDYVKAFLTGLDPSGRPPPGTLALLSAPEPASFTFAEFFGPGGPNEPVLKLVVTVSPPMELQ